MITALPVTILSILFLGRYIDKRKWSDFGIHLNRKKWWADFGFGIFVGLFTAGLFVFILILLGWAALEPSNNVGATGMSIAGAFLISFVTYLGIGIFEELLRVYQIRNLTEGFAGTQLGITGAMLLAVFFAGMYTVTMHIASNDFPFLVFILISGGMRGLYYLWTRRAAISIAAHFAWDFTVSYLFLLGGSSAEEPAIFLVGINQVIGINTTILLPVLGIFVKVIGLIIVVYWVKWREDNVQFHKEITRPSLI
jgi:membrane protease YdiL (CAAX protease family)